MKTSGAALLFGLALLPFIGRPLFFDDGAFAVAARAAAAHPLDPYRFTLDLGRPSEENWPAGGRPASTNPPLGAWLLAAAGALGGWKEQALHAVMFLAAALGLLAFSLAAAPFIGDAGVAVGLLALSPGYFLTALTLYPHVWFFLFHAASLALAARPPKKWTGPALGAAWTLAALSLHQWPLTLALSALFSIGKNGRRAAAPLLGAAAVFAGAYGGWMGWEAHLHGMPQFWASLRVRAMSGGYPWAAGFLPAVFWTAAFPSTLAGLVLLKEDRRAAGLAGLLGAGLYLLLVGPRGGFGPGEAAFLAFTAAGGAAFLLALPSLWRGAREDKILALWVLAEFSFVQLFLTLPAGHHLLPLGGATAAAAVRLADKFSIGKRTRNVFLAGTAILSLLLAHADFSEARLARRLAQDNPPPAPGRSFYWGNDFGCFEHYLKEAGWKAGDAAAEPRPGDVWIIPHSWTASGPARNFLEGKRWETLSNISLRQGNPLRTWSIGAGAGWYSASWGPLPYALAGGPVETMTVLRRSPDK